ncbi:MAG: hypothetical protein A2583_16080 [Bdellovibrionales bacterium RIFOXYD1_FULL_53_11]|nr:MAG: hypothetical protein A2583_16080 [Bdellovibrionales bacterium RIFOXYD1_FULL_53_11]
MEDCLMTDELTGFVIEAAKPKYMTGPHKLPKPSFLDFNGVWNDAFDLWDRIGVTEPALACIDRSGWKNEILEPTRLKIDERINRHKMMLAVHDAELDAALFQLIGARVPVAVTGGMDWSMRYYPERIFRQVQSVDLLVHPDAFQAAMRALAVGGYRATQSVRPSAMCVELVRKDDGPRVRLGRKLLVNDEDVHVAGILQRASGSRITGLPMNTMALSPEDNFVYLVRFGAVRNFLGSPVWLNDMHFLVESTEFKSKADWEHIMWSLAQSRALGGAWFALSFLASAWGTTIPREALEHCSHKVGAFRRRWLSHLAVNNWFPLRGRSLTWKLRSGLLLNDDTLEGLRGAFA